VELILINKLNMLCQNCNSDPAKYEVEAKDFRKNHIQKNSGKIKICEKCLSAFNERSGAFDAILKSKKDKKIIVAGPGTGKTYTFREYLKKKNSKTEKILIITFINNLVEDLIKEIKSDKILSEYTELKIQTLHSFSYSILTKYYKIFPNLKEIIIKDFEIINNKKIDEKELLKNLNNLISTQDVKFYFSRAKFYKAIGHDGATFLSHYFLKNKKVPVPIFSQIIVDEFQDLNFTEKSIVEILSTKNKILIAGDDDQSLYIFKFASPNYIRKIWKKDTTFDKLELPYCNRCTEVIVASVKKFIESCQKMGFLKDRIDKKYICYFPDKHQDCLNYDKINHYIVNNSSIVDFTIKEMYDIHSKEKSPEKERIDFLIICPRILRKSLLKSFKEKIEENTNFNILSEPDKEDEIKIESGYELLLKDESCNLGWRIVLYCDPADQEETAIKKSYNNDSDIKQYLNEEYIKKHLKLVKKYGEKEKEVLKDKKEEQDKKINVMITGYLGSKGLTAKHTFILYLNDGFMPEKKRLSEEELLQFLVGITRPKKSLNIISKMEYGKFNSILLRMMPEENIISQTIKKDKKGNFIKLPFKKKS